MSRKLVHVGHNHRFSLLPRRAAHASPIGNTRAGYGPLKRSEHQHGLCVCLKRIMLHPIKSRPPEAERLVQHSCHVCHLGNHVMLACYKRFDLRQQELICLGFAHRSAYLYKTGTKIQHFFEINKKTCKKSFTFPRLWLENESKTDREWTDYGSIMVHENTKKAATWCDSFFRFSTYWIWAFSAPCCASVFFLRG